MTWNFLVFQWLGLCILTAKGLGSIPGQGTKIPQAAWHNHKRKKKTVTNRCVWVPDARKSSSSTPSLHQSHDHHKKLFLVQRQAENIGHATVQDKTLTVGNAHSLKCLPITYILRRKRWLEGICRTHRHTHLDLC